MTFRDIEAGTAEFVSWDEVSESIGYPDERTAEEKELQHEQFERIATENEKIYETLLSPETRGSVPGA